MGNCTFDKQEDNTVEYDVTLLDNGLVIEDSDAASSECEKFSGRGDASDKAARTFLGRHILAELIRFCDEKMSAHVHVTITFSDNETRK